MSGETISLSSSGNITMLVFNGIEEECSYDKWERRLKFGLELKDVAYVLEDDFVVPTKLEANEDVSDDKSTKKRYEDNIKAKHLSKQSYCQESIKLLKNHEGARYILGQGFIVKVLHILRFAVNLN